MHDKAQPLLPSVKTMKNSGLLKWANNKKAIVKEDKGGNEKKWLHSPETLQKGHVAYLVKFLGSTEVDKPKGIEVVKQGIQKLKFNQQLKKSEGAKEAKPPKVELTISVEGVSIQEPKTKKVLHQYPLHKISYCADDRAEKRFFSFISKEEDSDKHTCFVFVSDKLAEEITLTIGQAFELAYKNYLDTSGKEAEQQKQQKKISNIERENTLLKSRLKELATLKDVKAYMTEKNITDLCYVEPAKPEVSENNNKSSSNSKDGNNKVEAEAADKLADTLINLDVGGGAGGDGFTLDDLNDLNDFNPRQSSEDEDDFDPRGQPQPQKAAAPAASAILSVHPPVLPPRDQTKITAPAAAQPIPNLFAQESNVAAASPTNPFSTSFGSASTTAAPSADPFGMSTFESAPSPFTQPPTQKSNLSGFGADAWATAAVTPAPAVNVMSAFDDLDPLRK